MNANTNVMICFALKVVNKTEPVPRVAFKDEIVILWVVKIKKFRLVGIINHFERQKNVFPFRIAYHIVK